METKPAPSGVTINIYTTSTDVPKCSSVEPKTTSVVVPKESADPDVERGDALDVELMTRDSLPDDEKMELEQRVVLFVREMLQQSKSSVVRDFLDKAKHHLDATLKESINEEITMLKKDL